jgi:hypothetical protein
VVEEVENGSRIVLAYNVLRMVPFKKISPINYRMRNQLDITVKGGLHGVPAVFNLIKETLESLNGENEEYFGVFLSHLYCNTGLTLDGLKGSDLVLYELLNSMDISVSLVPVVVKERYITPDWEEDKVWVENDNDEYCCEVFLLANSIDTRLPHHQNIEPITFYRPWMSETVTMHNFETFAHNSGNQVDPGNVDTKYIQAAMIAGPLKKSVNHEEKKE